MDDEDTKPELPIENYFALFCQPASDIKSSVVLPFIKGCHRLCAVADNNKAYALISSRRLTQRLDHT